MSTAPNYPKHSAATQARLTQVEAEAEGMLTLGEKLTGSRGSSFYPLDLVCYGAIKRNLSTARAISLMVVAWNMAAARTLLRVHIDTSLRFSAAWLVEKPHDFAMEVLRDTRIDKLKDRDGQRLTDARLVEIRSVDYPWLPEVYERLCGYVHFFGSHIYDSVSKVGVEDLTFELDVASIDDKFPEESWLEVLDCFSETSGILTRYLHGYIQTKSLGEEQLESLRPKGG